MSWRLIGLAGTAVMGFWFIYDRVKNSLLRSITSLKDG